MAITPNRTLIQKAQDLLTADLTSSGGLMVPEQRTRFYVTMIEKAKLLKKATWYLGMTSPKLELPTIKFGGDFLYPSGEGAALPSDSMLKPTLSKPTLDVHTYKGRIGFSEEALEDNIEQGLFVNTVMGSMPDVVARDMEKLVIQSAKNSATARLAKFDGLLYSLQSHVTPVSPAVLISIDQLEAALSTLPVEYTDDPTGLEFYTSVRAERAYRQAYGKRMTPGGDTAATRREPMEYQGIPINGLAGILNTIGGANTTNIVLMNPANLAVGVHRDVKLGIWQDPLSGMYYVICSVRFDAVLQDEDGTAKVTGVSVAI